MSIDELSGIDKVLTIITKLKNLFGSSKTLTPGEFSKVISELQESESEIRAAKSQLMDENTNLREENRGLKSEVKKLKDIIEGDESSIELDETTVAVLKILDVRPTPAARVASQLNITEGKARYHLDKLSELGFAAESNYVTHDWSIWPEGRKFLYESA